MPDSEDFASDVADTVPGPEPLSVLNAWYDEAAKSVYKPEIYQLAAEALIAEGKASSEMFDFDADGYRDPTSDFIDGVSYDGTKPNAYIDSLAIGLKGSQTVAGSDIVN